MPRKIPLIIIAVFLAILSGGLLIGESRAAFNTQINYQGKLTDTSDDAVSNGDYNFKFRLCITSGCTDASDPIWSETRETTNKVTVTKGIFSVLLGEVTSIASVNFNQTLWLEVQVGGTGSSPSYETLTPRKKLGAVAAAFEADKLDGVDSASFLRSDASASYTSGTLSLSDGTFLNLAAILHDDTANQGFRLPQASSATPSSPTSGEGYLAWDSSGNQLITYTGTSWSAVGASGWSDGGTDVTLTTSTDNVGIGGASLAKLSVDGDTDEIQFLVQGHSTQTSNLVVFENSAGTDLLTVDARTTTSGASTFTLAGLAQTIASEATAEYTTLTVTPPTITLTGTTQVTSQMDSVLVSAPTITDASVITVDDVATVTIAGAPVGANNVTISDSYALKINAGATASSTRAYGLYVDAPTGATTNYGAAFASGNVGIGTTSPSHKLTLVDGTFRQNISSVSSLSIAGSVVMGDTPLGVYVFGRYAYVTNYWADRLSIVNITNPASPTVEGTLTDATDLDGPTGIVVAGRYAYIAADLSNKLVIVDISNPTSPIKVATLAITSIGLDSKNIDVVGKYAYIAEPGGSLVIVDVSNPASPTTAGTLGGLGGPRSVQVVGGYAYIDNSAATDFAVVDVSNPASPTLAGGVNHSCANIQSSLYVAGNYAYVVVAGACNAFIVVDITNPAVPSIVVNSTSLGLSSPRDIQVSGRYAYVSNFGSDTLMVIDISNPGSPTKVAELTSSTLDEAGGIFVAGKYAYIGADGASDRLVIVDTSGVDIPSANIGDLFASSIDVGENLYIGGNLYAQSGLNVGPRGIYSQGPSSFYGAAIITGIAPTIASAATAEYTTLTVTPPTITLTGTTQVTSQMDSVLVSAPTITDASVITVDDVATVTIAGAPVGANNVTISDSYALKINAGATASSTRAYGLYVDAPTGATTNYGAAFATGNVGIGTTVPTSTLHVAGQCVTGDTRLRRRRRKSLPTGGLPQGDKTNDYEYDEVMIKDIQPGDEVLTLHEQTGKFVWSTVKALMDMGVKPTFQMVTASGKRIRTTGNHPYFTRIPTMIAGSFEIDQSNRIEDLTKDSVLAVANKDFEHIIVIPKELKRELYKEFAGKRFRKSVWAPAIFARAVAYLLLDAGIEGSRSRIIIDREYPGYEAQILQFIQELYTAQIEVEFRSVGKKSPAHLAAYGVTRNKKSAGPSVTRVAKGALHPVIAPGISQPPSSRVSSVYSKQLDLSRAPRWTKVWDIQVGWEVATTEGWEKIVALRRVGTEQVYDIEVEGTHNFVGNDIVAHNTTFGGGTETTLVIPNISALTGSGNSIAGSGAGAALTSGTNNTLFGVNAGDVLTTGAGNIILGSNADPSSATAANEFVAGSALAAITNVYFGEGPLDITPLAYTINGTGGSGTDIAGAALQLAGGRGTGTGAGGSIVFQTTAASSTGSTLNILETRMTIDSAGNVGIGAVAASGMELDVAGQIQLDLAGTQTSVALCGSHAAAGGASVANVEIVDCTGTPAADYMEMYSVESDVQPGDIVTTGNSFVETLNGDKLSRLTKSFKPYERNIIGVVSQPDYAGDFNSIGHNIKPEDNPKPIALSGRVKVKVSLESGPILVGDYITSSAEPGVGMKATKSGRVIGMALEPFDGITNNQETITKILVFVNPHWSIGALNEEGLLPCEDELCEVEPSTSFIAMVRSAIESFTGTIKTAGHWVFEKITAKTVRIEKLEMVDQSTGEVYCTWIENGEWVKAQGDCEKSQTPSSNNQTNSNTENSNEQNDETKEPVDEQPVEEPPIEEPVEEEVIEEPPQEGVGEVEPVSEEQAVEEPEPQPVAEEPVEEQLPSTASQEPETEEE